MSGIIGKEPFGKSGVIGKFTSVGIDDNASGATAVTIDANENVGIGTTSLNNEERLHVSGRDDADGYSQILQVSDTDDITKHVFIGYDRTNDYGEIGAVDTGTGFKKLRIGPADTCFIANVAVGSDFASSSNVSGPVLHIGNSSAGSCALILEDNQEKWELAVDETFNIMDGATMRHRIYSGGEVDMSFHGDTSSSGSTCYINSSGRMGTSTSLREHKGNIKKIDIDAIALMNKFEPVTFNYKKYDTDTSSYLEELESGFEAGMIVDDIQDFASDFNMTDAEKNVIGIRYHLFTPYFIKAIQELSTKNDALEARVTALESA